MTIDKVIKEFKNEGLTYQLGYDLGNNKVYPIIEIYKNRKLLSGCDWCDWCDWCDGADAGSFYFFADCSSSYSNGYVNTIKEMFTKLREYNEIPEYIEREYEKIFLMYKLNDFKEL